MNITNQHLDNPGPVIHEFIVSNSSRAQTLDNEDNIFELGFVTSLFAMRLLEFIEVTFDVQVPDDAISLSNFASVDRMTKLVFSLRGSSDG